MKFLKNLTTHLKNSWYQYVFEAIVVTLSIFGAFKLNDWAENRKFHEVQITLLQDLKFDLERIKFDLDRDLDLHKKSRLSAQNIFELIQNKGTITDSLIIDFELARNDFQLEEFRTAYDIMKSKGGEILSNKELRNFISYFYNSNLPLLQRIELRGQVFYNALTPYYKAHFKINTVTAEEYRSKGLWSSNSLMWNTRYNGTSIGFIPKDLNHIYDDPEFKLILRDVIYERNNVISFYEFVQQRLDYLIKSIDSEIQAQQKKR